MEKKGSSSAVLDSSDLESYFDDLDDSEVPTKVFKSFTAMPLIDATQSKEAEMWSLMSFPGLIEEMEKVCYSIT